MTGSKQVNHWTSGTVYKCSKIAGSLQPPPSSQLCWLWSQQEDLQQAWNQDRRAVWDQVGLCSETMLTGESQFHISIPMEIEPGFLMTGNNWWTTGPVELCMNAVRLQTLQLLSFKSEILMSVLLELNWGLAPTITLQKLNLFLHHLLHHMYCKESLHSWVKVNILMRNSLLPLLLDLAKQLKYPCKPN